MASNQTNALGAGETAGPASIEELEKAWWLAELEAESLYECLMWIQKEGNDLAISRVYQKYKVAQDLAQKLHVDLLEQIKNQMK